jgi:hypothetical protein
LSPVRTALVDFTAFFAPFPDGFGGAIIVFESFLFVVERKLWTLFMHCVNSERRNGSLARPFIREREDGPPTPSGSKRRRKRRARPNWREVRNGREAGLSLLCMAHAFRIHCALKHSLWPGYISCLFHTTLPLASFISQQ